VTRSLPLLRQQIVFLEVTDAHCVDMNPQRYQAAARSARAIVERELGGLAMKDFQLPGAPALQTTAENIYFETYGHFADLDGSGYATTAKTLASELIARARVRR
jgi:hypothetical protein